MTTRETGGLHLGYNPRSASLRLKALACVQAILQFVTWPVRERTTCLAFLFPYLPQMGLRTL